MDGGEQAHLVVQSLAAENLDYVACQTLLALKLEVEADNLVHAFAQSRDDLGSDLLTFEQAAVVAAGHGVLDAQTCGGIEIVEGLVEQHAERARVDPCARGGGGVEKLDLLRGEDRIVEVFGLVVDAGADGLQTGYAVAETTEDFVEGLAAVKGDVFAEIDAEDFELLAHLWRRL